MTTAKRIIHIRLNFLQQQRYKKITLNGCKMAVNAVVLCNPLCFLVNKFGRTAAKPLKSMILDFYDVGVLCDAKSQLICDIRGLNLDIDMPHVPERRDSGNKAMLIVDDMFTLMSFLDENLKLTLLPRYVADNPDSLPSSRLYEGDLSILMNLIGKMENEIKELNIALAIVLRETYSRGQGAPVLCSRLYLLL